MNFPYAPHLMARSNALADWNHPDVAEKAKVLSIGCYSPRERFHALHEFVRERIPFGFNEKGHMAKASEVLAEGRGFSNTKTTLLLALCRAAGIPARVRFGRIRSNVLKGLVSWLPATIPHSFLEVELEGRYRPVDSYIVDRPLASAALRNLQEENRRMGYGLVLDGAPFSLETCLDGQGFVQMGAVVEEYDTFDDPGAFFQSAVCKSHDRIHEGLLGRLYRQRLPELNARIAEVRAGS